MTEQMRPCDKQMAKDIDKIHAEFEERDRVRARELEKRKKLGFWKYWWSKVW